MSATFYSKRNGDYVYDVTPGDNLRIGPTRLEDWLSRSLTR
jgi:hypothetical protein